MGVIITLLWAVRVRRVQNVMVTNTWSGGAVEWSGVEWSGLKAQGSQLARACPSSGRVACVPRQRSPHRSWERAGEITFSLLFAFCKNTSGSNGSLPRRSRSERWPNRTGGKRKPSRRPRRKTRVPLGAARWGRTSRTKRHPSSSNPRFRAPPGPEVPLPRRERPRPYDLRGRRRTVRRAAPPRVKRGGR